MSRRFRPRLLEVVLLATLAGCASPQTGEQPEPLDRWLEGESQVGAAESAAEVEVREPPRRVTLESLEAERTPLSPASVLPPAEYFHFQLPRATYVSVAVSSQTGAAIALIDRTEGGLSRSGAIGQTDGRIDTLLDSGEYRVRVDTAAAETARVQVHEFTEVETNSSLLMNGPPGLLHTLTLRDLEQRSYWVQVAAGELLVVEALGRALHDVKIWRDGVWVIENEPSIATYSPVPGQTMGYIQTSYRVEPGAYLVTFYGGPARVWEEETGENPFYIRRGARYLGSIVDANTRISPMGRDAYLVSGDVTIMEVENPDFVPVTLGIGAYGQDTDRFRASGSATLQRSATSTRARGSVSRGAANTRRWLFVSGTPGDTVRIRALPVRTEYLIDRPPPGSRYLISTISTLDSDHAIDATPVISQRDSRTNREVLVRSEPLTVTETTPLVREVNLTGAATFVVDLDRAGRWGFLHDWAEDAVEVAVVPLQETADNPATQADNPASFDLEAGKHVVMIWGRRQGVFRFVLYYQGFLALGADLRARPLLRSQAPLPRADITYLTDVNEIAPDVRHTVAMNERGGPSSALFVERIPLSLREAFPLTLAPGQRLTLPVATEVAGALSTGMSGIGMKRNGQTVQDGQTLPSGAATLELTNTGTSTITFVLELSPAFTSLFSAPAIPDLEESLPVLRPGVAVYHDYNRTQTRQFLLVVQDPGFYELQTTGRLATSITTRTQVRTRGPGGSANGPGRNALVQGFFRPGAYLVNVAATGNSTGRAGLLMAPLALHTLGKLHEGVWYRTELEAGVGLVSTVVVESAGSYDFRTLGLYGPPTARVEDEDAWPVETERLRPGVYRYYTWPQKVWSRRLTAYTRRPDPPTPASGQAWPIVLNRAYHRVWDETPNRAPHRFVVESPAPLPVVVSVSSPMDWWIQGPGGQQMAQGSGTANVVLPAGASTVLVRSREENNDVDYDISLTTQALASGIDQGLRGAPHNMSFVAGEDGTYEIWSTGTWDLRATLRTEDGDRVLAQGDDRPGDWNFHISRYLKAGEYVLEVDSLFSSYGEATISCLLRNEVWADTQALPVTASLGLERDIVGIPFRTPAGDSLVRITADLPTVDLSLYREETLIAQGRDTLVVPLLGDREYLLRMRNDSFETAVVAVDVRTTPTQRVSWDGGSPLDLPAGGVVVSNAGGVSAHVTGATGRLLVSSAPERMARPPDGGIVAAPGGAIWVWSDPVGGPVRIQPLTSSAGSTTVASLTDDDISLRIETTADRVYVAEALSATGVIGMSAEPFPASAGPRRWSGADMESSTTVLGLAGNGPVQVWLWDGQPSEPGRRVEVTLWVSEPTVSATLRPGSYAIEPGQAVTVDTREAEGVRVLLSPGLVAMATTGGSTVKTVAAREGNIAAVMPGGGTLHVANTGSHEGLARMEPSAAAPSLMVSQTTGLETRLDTAPTIIARVAQTPTTPSSLAVWAVEPSAVLILTDSGRRVTARAPGPERPYWLLPNVAGEVRVAAGPGPVLVLPLANTQTLTSWAAGGSGQATTLQAGPNPLDTRAQRWTLTLDHRVFVSLATQSRGVTVLLPSSGASPAPVMGSGGTRSVFAVLDPGSHTVLTRPLAGERQPDPLWLRVLDPIAISERTVSSPLFLDAGEQVVFQVDVRERSPVGIGLSAEADDFVTHLLDDELHLLGSGRIHYEELDAGRYYFVVENGGLPMRVEPVVLSDQGSRTGVPEDVIQTYRGQ